MNTDRNARRSSGTARTTRRLSGPVVLDPPPAWLSQVPTGILREHKRPSPEDGLLGWLRGHSIYARPTLAEVEAERARRGLRSGVVIATEGHPAPARIVLSMPSEYRTPEQDRQEAQRNRVRIELALGDLAGDVLGIHALGYEVADAARAEERAA